MLLTSALARVEAALLTLRRSLSGRPSHRANAWLLKEMFYQHASDTERDWLIDEADLKVAVDSGGSPVVFGATGTGKSALPTVMSIYPKSLYLSFMPAQHLSVQAGLCACFW